MCSRMLILFSVSTFCSMSVFATVAQDDSKTLKFSETSKYASPQLYVFGGYNNQKFLSSASQFNSTSGEWDATTAMSVKKDRLCGVVVGTKIYLIGGYTGEEKLQTAEVYDCETGTYSQYRSMPSSSSGCGAAFLNGFIYVAGGDDGAKGLPNIVRYNIQTTRRENVHPMHNGRKGLQLIELAGRLYAIGGGTKSVEVYNATTDRWTTAASTKYEHKFTGATVHAGKIYIISDAGFEEYSPDTDSWESLPPHDNGEGKTLVSMNGKLWALGGGKVDILGSKSVFTFNTLTRQWSEQANMDVARKFHAAFVVNH